MIIDGKALAKEVRNDVKIDVAKKRAEGHRAPGLATILIGDDAASHVYIKYKRQAAKECGIESFHHALPSTLSQQDLLNLVEKLNHSDEVDGILVQLPLPKHIDKEAVLNAIDPSKDVDGFHPINVARLSLGHQSFVPCTPLGCLRLLKTTGTDLKGKTALVVGRSDIVGKPMVQLLLAEDATLMIAHSKTKNLEALAQSADIVIAAVGKKHLIGKEHIKPGAIVIDVGITRGDDGKLYGDVDFEAVKDIAAHITPVPGGVGPMTIAMLMKNTSDAYAQHINNSPTVNKVSP